MKTIVSFWGPAYFQGRTVSFRESRSLLYICLLYIICTLELAVLALARIMCANIHSQNGTAILAQELLSRK